jgi:hypothetical protein
MIEPIIDTFNLKNIKDSLITAATWLVICYFYLMCIIKFTWINLIYFTRATGVQCSEILKKHLIRQIDQG